MSLARLTFAVSATAGFPPLLLLFARQFGHALTAGQASAMWALCTATIWVWALREAARHRMLSGAAVGLVVLTLGTTAIKLATTKDLDYGFWGDALQHTMIAQLIVDHGGLFSDWRPYADLGTFTYHFGFHANVAFLHWITGMPVAKATVMAGQLMQVFSMLTTAGLAGALVEMSSDHEGKARHAGVASIAAGLIVGYMNTIPAFLPNWGRYTQLAGQVILPGVLLAWLRLIVGQGSSTVVRAGIAAALTAMLGTTHYLVTLFAALMVGAALVIFVLTSRPPARGWLDVVGETVFALAVAAALLLPWGETVLTSQITQLASRPLQAASGSGPMAITPPPSLEPISPLYLRPWLLASVPLATLLAAANRQRWVFACGIWCALLIATITPGTLGLPGNGIIDYLTAYMCLYVPAGVLAGNLAAQLTEWFARVAGPWIWRLVWPAATLVIVSVTPWAARWQIAVLEPANYALMTAADHTAMLWVRENTAPDARFWPNRFPAYGGTLVAGSDGGWWISLLTLRASQLPPLNYGVEAGLEPDFLNTVNTQSAAARGAPLTITSARPVTLGVAQQIDGGVTHVYLGPTVKPAGTDAIRQASLAPAWTPVYTRAGVSIWAASQRQP